MDTAGFLLEEELILAGFFIAMAGFFTTPFGILTVQLYNYTAYRFEQEIGLQVARSSWFDNNVWNETKH